jgi:hypothetical protein
VISVNGVSGPKATSSLAMICRSLLIVFFFAASFSNKNRSVIAP